MSKDQTIANAADNIPELTRAEVSFEDADLASVDSFANALELLSASGIIPEGFAETYGTGFAVLDTKDKKRLVGVDFVILEWAFNEGDNGTFVSAAIVTEPGEKLILNDGSTGICKQLQGVTATRLSRGFAKDAAYKGLNVKGGLRESTYKTKDDGTPLTREEMRDHPELAKGSGATYYLAN